MPPIRLATMLRRLVPALQSTQMNATVSTGRVPPALWQCGRASGDSRGNQPNMPPLRELSARSRANRRSAEVTCWFRGV